MTNPRNMVEESVSHVIDNVNDALTDAANNVAADILAQLGLNDPNVDMTDLHTALSDMAYDHIIAQLKR